MLDGPRSAPVAVVSLPAEIDLTNAEVVTARVRASLQPGATAVIADLTSTVFCDSAGIRQLLLASDLAQASGARLLLAAPEDGAVRRVLRVTGMHRLLPAYSTVQAALDAADGA
jgi:anti-sigma B factor antagonist